MDARDITPERLAHAMRECFRLEGNKTAENRLDAMGESLIKDPDCASLVLSLYRTLHPQSIRPYVHFQILLGVGITVGLNLAQQVQELKDLEVLG